MIINDVARVEDMIKKLVELKTVAISYRQPTNINDVIMEALWSFEQEFKDICLPGLILIMRHTDYSTKMLVKTSICNIKRSRG